MILQKPFNRLSLWIGSLTVPNPLMYIVHQTVLYSVMYSKIL